MLKQKSVENEETSMTGLRHVACVCVWIERVKLGAGSPKLNIKY